MAVDPIPTNRQDGTTIRAAHVNELAEGVNDLQAQIDDLPPGGYSAYELWLQEGNTGTIEDFFDSLRGAPGAPLAPKGTVDEVGDLPGSGAVGDVWIVLDTGHAWGWDGAEWRDIGRVTLTDLDETGSAPSIGLTGSSIDKVETGDLFMAVETVAAGAIRGGVIRSASGLHVAVDYHQTAKPSDVAVGTFLGVDWQAVIDDPGGFGPQAQTSYYGPRPAINLEGNVRYARNQNAYSFSPVGIGDFLAVGNTAGDARTIVPSWPFLGGRIYFADGATVTHGGTDVSKGGATFVDSQTIATINGGTWDGEANDAEMISFLSLPWLVGDGVLSKRVAYDVADFNSNEHSTGVNAVRAAMASVLGGTVDAQDVTLGTNIGLRIPRMSNGVRNIGVLNASATVETPAAVTVTASSTIPRDVSVVHATSASVVTVTSTPIIAAGLPGQSVTVVNVGSNQITLAGELPGSASAGTAGTGIAHTVSLTPGGTVRLRWTGTRWEPTEVSNPRVTTSLGTINLYGGDHRYPQFGAGSYFTLAYAGFGPGSSTDLDTWLTRASSGTINLGSTIAATDGTLVAAYQRAIGDINRSVYGPTGISVSPVENPDDNQPTAGLGSLFGVGFVSLGSGAAAPDVWLSRPSAGVANLGTYIGGATGVLGVGRVRLNNYANEAAIPNPHVVGDLAVVAGAVMVCTTAGSPGAWTVVGSQT